MEGTPEALNIIKVTFNEMQEPEKYLPERFMEGTAEAAAKPAHGYLPFGDGVRACIGLRFAKMEVGRLLCSAYCVMVVISMRWVHMHTIERTCATDGRVSDAV